MWKIKIQYRTGDSFGSEETEDYIDLEWNDLNVIKENLQRIQEHYAFYEDTDSGYRRPDDFYNQLNENKNKKWFVYSPKLVKSDTKDAIDEKAKSKYDGNWEYVPDPFICQHYLYLKLDDGTEFKHNAFWCGYFERLRSAEIVLDGSEFKFTI